MNYNYFSDETLCTNEGQEMQIKGDELNYGSSNIRIEYKSCLDTANNTQNCASKEEEEKFWRETETVDFFLMFSFKHVDFLNITQPLQEMTNYF